MNTNAMTVRSKFAWAFGLLVLATLCIGLLAIWSLGQVNRRFEDYVRGINARATAVHLVREAIDLRAIAARNLVLVKTPQDLALEKATVQRAHADVQTHLQTLQALAQAEGSGEQAQTLIAAIAAVEAQYAPVALSIVDLALQGQEAAAIQKMNDACRPLLVRLIEATENFRRFTDARAGEELSAAASSYTQQKVLVLFIMVLAMVWAVVIGLLLTRSMAAALGAEPSALAHAVLRVAEGDFTARLPAVQGGSDSVLASVARMQEALGAVVARVRRGADIVAHTSLEIARGNQDLSSRTEHQATALERTAAAARQLGGTVQHNADNAAQASTLAHSASTVAQQGGALVHQVVQTMGEINDSSKRIEAIIGVIDGIAFQTNILALNAAVEAARAGEQGRGFAVVAGEVRSLAQRSSEAAREIKALIGNSVQKVEKGTAVANQAGSTMNDIVSGIQRVSDIVSQISAAAQEQSAGVRQVGDAVLQMDQATQQNATLVEQIAAAATTLEAQAQDLARTVAAFKLSHGALQALPA